MKSPRHIERLQNTLVLSCSVLLVLVVGELVARIWLPAPLPWLYPQLRYRPDPTLVFTLVPNQHAFSANTPVTINERGLRGPIVPYDPEAGEFRLLILGDSIVFGYGVPVEGIIGTRLKALVDSGNHRTQVINTGVPSYNTEQEVEFLRTEGVRYSPNWVIVGFCWNDLSDKTGVRVDGNGMLVSEGAGEPNHLRRMMESELGYQLRNALKESRLLYALSIGTAILGGGDEQGKATSLRTQILSGETSSGAIEGWNRVENALGRLADLSRVYHFKVLVAAFPTLSSIEESHPSSSYPSTLRLISARLGINFIDLQPAFRRNYRGRTSLFLPYDPDHPNSTGHRIAAEEVARFLVQSSFESPTH